LFDKINNSGKRYVVSNQNMTATEQGIYFSQEHCRDTRIIRSYTSGIIHHYSCEIL